MTRDKFSSAREILDDVQYQLAVMKSEAYLAGVLESLPAGNDALLLFMSKAACVGAAVAADRSPEEIKQDDVRLAMEILIEALADASREVTNQLAARELYNKRTSDE